MWRAARQRTEPARDWYLCHCERSEPCLKKCAHWFCCPLNKQRDISSQSFCWPALSSGFCRPLRHHSSHQCRSKADTVLFSRDHWHIVFPNSVLFFCDILSSLLNLSLYIYLFIAWTLFCMWSCIRGQIYMFPIDIMLTEFAKQHITCDV